LLYNLIEALDSTDGAAGNYREAVSFLRDLKRTLDPSEILAAWNAYPSYANDISDQVRYIKGPVKEFLNAVASSHVTSVQQDKVQISNESNILR
jgi:hypothetical protein